MKRLVFLLNVLFSIVGILSIPLALTSVMLFDAPGSENNGYLWVTFWSALALPVSCLISIIFSSRISLKTQNYKKALLVLLIPCLVIAILAWSLIMIEIHCGGSFSCGK